MSHGNVFDPNAQNASGAPPGQPPFGQPPYGQPPGQPPYGQPPGQPPYGQPPGQPPFGQPPGQPPFGQPPGQPPFGQPPGQPPFGQPPGQPPFGQPPGAPTIAAQPKKKGKGLIIGGCLGCLGILLSICVCSGWLLYLEEGVSYSAPGDEITSVPITSGQPIRADVTWNGTGYTDVRVYVDLGESAPTSSTVRGTFGCEEYGSMRMEDVSEYYYGGSSSVPDGWVQIPPRYMYHRASPSPIHCEGMLSLPSGISSARLVFTSRQRPSDWLSEWF